MIRFVDIPRDAEVMPGQRCFAWFDTVTDRFLVFNHDQVWASWTEFLDHWHWDERPVEQKHRLDRFEGLLPKEWKE